MSKRILITGGAGFIGSHLCDELLAHGYRVRVLDSLSKQVHGSRLSRPDYLDPEVELLVGDVRDQEAVNRALTGIDMLVHLAASVGVGQSMYEICHYTQVNGGGTAVVLEAVLRKPVEKLLVASSMSIYGEGLYQDSNGNRVEWSEREPRDLEQGRWDPCDRDGNPLRPVPTPETKKPHIASIYALSKYDQERMCLLAGRAYNVPVAALRFFNVYGPRQALSNPYTGVLAIFGSRLLNGNPPIVFEDGCQLRDFVHVRDVAKACRLALVTEAAKDCVLNIGSGRAYSINQIAEQMAQSFGTPDLQPQITQNYRSGDIRHCYADITRARQLIGYEPTINLRDGIDEFQEWTRNQICEDRVPEAFSELSKRGLAIAVSKR